MSPAPVSVPAAVSASPGALWTPAPASISGTTSVRALAAVSAFTLSVYGAAVASGALTFSCCEGVESVVAGRPRPDRDTFRCLSIAARPS